MTKDRSRLVNFLSEVSALVRGAIADGPVAEVVGIGLA